MINGDSFIPTNGWLLVIHDDKWWYLGVYSGHCLALQRCMRHLEFAGLQYQQGYNQRTIISSMSASRFLLSRSWSKWRCFNAQWWHLPLPCQTKLEWKTALLLNHDHVQIVYHIFGLQDEVNAAKTKELMSSEQMESMSASSLEMQTSCLSQAIAAYFEASLLRCNLAKFLLDVLGFRKSDAGQPSLPYGKT